MVIDGSFKVVAISMISCIGVAWTHVRSVCAPTSSAEEATKVELLVMGLFVSSALFELS